jgi:hypothetical protein
MRVILVNSLGDHLWSRFRGGRSVLHGCASIAFRYAGMLSAAWPGSCIAAGFNAANFKSVSQISLSVRSCAIYRAPCACRAASQRDKSRSYAHMLVPLGLLLMAAHSGCVSLRLIGREIARAPDMWQTRALKIPSKLAWIPALHAQALPTLFRLLEFNCQAAI